MKPGYSIRARLLLGAALVLLAFMAGAGIAVQRAHADSVRDVHFSRLQGTVYLLLARAELDDTGALVMPPNSPSRACRCRPPASMPHLQRQAQGGLASASTLGTAPPFRREAADRRVALRDLEQDRQGAAILAVSYGVRWAGRNGDAPLVLSVLEDKAEFDREIACSRARCGPGWAAPALLLLLAQTAAAAVGLAPLRAWRRRSGASKAGSRRASKAATRPRSPA
jgi:two-component system sensor histidine kinase PhoQ